MRGLKTVIALTLILVSLPYVASAVGKGVGFPKLDQPKFPSKAFKGITISKAASAHVKAQDVESFLMCDRASTMSVSIDFSNNKIIITLTDNVDRSGRWFHINKKFVKLFGIDPEKVSVKLNGQPAIVEKSRNFISVYIPHFSTNTITIEQVSGRYKIVYKKVKPGDVLSLNLPGTLSNETIEVIANVTPLNSFDNSGGGNWSRIKKFQLSGPLSEYAQYKLVINGSTWELYNVTGALEGSGSVTDFWSLVNSSGADIRVFNDTYTQMYFWIESWDYTNQKAVIWVNLTAGSSELNIAYGNPSALPSVYNNESKTFPLVDRDWDLTKYTEVPATGDANWGVASNVIDGNTLYASYVATGEEALVRNNFSMADVVVSVDMKFGETGTNIQPAIDIRWVDNSNRIHLRLSDYSDTIGLSEIVGGTSTLLAQSGTITFSTASIYHVDIYARGNQVRAVVYQDGSLLWDSGWVTTSFTSAGSVAPRFVAGSTTAVIYWDNLVVKSSADPADVSSTKNIDATKINNGKITVNSNDILIGNIPNGQSSGKISVDLTGNDTIIYNADYGEADIIVEADYSDNVTVTVTYNETSIEYTFTYSPANNVVNATLTLSLDRNWEYEINSALLNGNPISYKILPRSDIKSPDVMVLNLGDLVANQIYDGLVSLSKKYLKYVFSGDRFDSVDLSRATVVLNDINSPLIKFGNINGSVVAGDDYIEVNNVLMKFENVTPAIVKIVELNTLRDRYQFIVSSNTSNNTVTFRIKTDDPNTWFAVFRNGTYYDVARTDVNGWLNYTYLGGFSTWSFTFSKLYTSPEKTPTPTPTPTKSPPQVPGNIVVVRTDSGSWFVKFLSDNYVTLIVIALALVAIFLLVRGRS